MIVGEHWLQLILSGRKIVELRSRRAALGFVWIAKGNVIYASAVLTRQELLSEAAFKRLREAHCVSTAKPYPQTHGIWMEQVQQLRKPVPFLRLAGSIGWARVRFAAGKPETGTFPDRRTAPAEQSSSRDAVETKDEEVAEPLGLCNIGNTCYLNAVLQNVLHSRELMARVREHRRTSCAGPCLRCLLLETDASRAHGRGTADVMKKWQPFLEQHGFRAGAQEPAQELAHHILSSLHETEAGGRAREIGFCRQVRCGWFAAVARTG